MILWTTRGSLALVMAPSSHPFRRSQAIGHAYLRPAYEDHKILKIMTTLALIVKHRFARFKNINLLLLKGSSSREKIDLIKKKISNEKYNKKERW